MEHQPRVARVRLSPHLFVLLAFATLIAVPLTAPGYFIFAHDARHTVYFMQMFDAALRDGALFPRWAEDMVFGYGYPVWLILAPLPYYAAEFFHLLGFDFPSSIKAVEVVAWYASALGMYLFGRRVLGKDGGLVAAVAYLFIPYHLVDLYVRGAMAEFLAFVFPPLILWALYQIFYTRRPFYVPLAAFAYAALILTHISMAVLFSPVFAGYILVLWLWNPRPNFAPPETVPSPGDPTIALPHASTTAPSNYPTTKLSHYRTALTPVLLASLSIIWGLLLAAVFLLPIFLEQRYLTSEPLIGGFFDFRLHFVTPAELISTFWGYGYAGTNGNDQFSLQLGIVPLVLSVVALLTIRRRDPLTPQIIYFAIVLLGGVLAMLYITEPLWVIAAPVIAFAQFPWRVLFVTSTALAVLSGASLRFFARLPRFRANSVPAASAGTGTPQLSSNRSDLFPVALILCLLLALAMFPFARPQYTDSEFTWNTLMDFEVNSRELLGDTVFTLERPQDSPLVAEYRAGNITTKAVVVEGDGSVQLLDRRPSGDSVKVNATTPVRLMFYTRYFPGWTATVDGVSVPVHYNGDQGLIAVHVPAGSHTVATHWGTTTARVVGAIISFTSLILALLWLWKTRKPGTEPSLGDIDF